MRASLAQLEAFYWIARLGSFHAAARHLHVTQPTVSARIAELENLLGARLFDRDRQKAELTTRGRGMVDSVDRMLRLSDDIARHSGSNRTLRGLLRLGAVESVALLALPRLLPRFIASYPDLKVELTLDVGASLSRKLNAGELDVAILTDPQVNDSITVEPVGRIALAWMASHQLKLPNRVIQPRDLRKLPIFTMPNPSTIFISMSHWFNVAEVEPEHVSSCNSLALMARLIVEGQGVAVLPTALMQAEIDSGLIRTLTTRMPLASGTMAVAHSGPAHRYRLLNRLIIKALNESGLMEPL
jgi:DNA-binding transcriptional LysR family regulator